MKTGKATIFGDGDAQNSWTDAPDVARYIAHVLTHVPREKLEWQTLRIQGDLAVRTLSSLSPCPCDS